MRIAFITRSTLFEVHGGITVQVIETAKHLREMGVSVTVYLANEKINYNDYDLFHLFDITRPANILYHIKRANKPFVLSPVLIDYSEYDKQHRRGFSGFIFRRFSADINEYIKAVSRWILKKDRLQSKNYIWKGHRKSIQDILKRVEMILPNSQQEYDELKKVYNVTTSYTVVPNGIDEKLFKADNSVAKDKELVICAARIEGIKNQLNLIKALNNTGFQLLLIGDAAPNQRDYYRQCRNLAGNNIKFINRLSQAELINYYKRAKVHVLPSWFETCGLSSLEAAAMGCNIVITNKGFTRDYFDEEAFYCDPESAESIYQAVNDAAESPSQKKLQTKILKHYTWHHVASQTLEAYKKVLPGIQ
jgi:glycosyltransferase involved in cell wall biosynthesis